MQEPSYIKVILPLKLSWEPWYRVSEEVRTGTRVSVRFAGRKYIGVVSAAGLSPDVDPSRILDVESVERHMDPIGEKELELWRFIAEYYLCSIGEVYKMAYPSGKTSGEEVRARSEERREALKARTEELFRKRIAALEERLAKKEASLAGRHGPKVVAALEAGRDKILSELEKARASFAALRTTEEEIPSEGHACDYGRGESETSHDTADITAAFAQGKTVLLHGGSARTGILAQAARDTLSSGRDVLFLVPEIALSKQLQRELGEAFGSDLLVFHSAESAGNRREVASILRRHDRPRLVLGTRSAIFLPFKDLGLVIIDEEHDPAYKQDGTPRYGARDTAVMLGSIHGAHVLLSSPTPSLESLYNCITGRYALVRMPLEESAMEIVDTSVEARKRGMVGDLSRILIAHVNETLGQGGTVMIIRPWGPMDDLAEQVKGIFPDAGSLIRYATVHEARRTDISDVSLLALIGADALMDRHDFRADEKAMQTLEQLRGRLSGRMLVQTRQGGHPVFSLDSDYSLRLLEERKAFRLPPYSRMVDILVRDSNAGRLAKLSGLLASSLAGFSPEGPSAPFRGREADPEARTLRILLPRGRNLQASKKEIAAVIGDFEKSYKYTGHIALDVDPV